jgi:hypothetical protein
MSSFRYSVRRAAGTPYNSYATIEAMRRRKRIQRNRGKTDTKRIRFLFPIIFFIGAYRRIRRLNLFSTFHLSRHFRRLEVQCRFNPCSGFTASLRTLRLRSGQEPASLPWKAAVKFGSYKLCSLDCLQAMKMSRVRGNPDFVCTGSVGSEELEAFFDDGSEHGEQFVELCAKSFELLHVFSGCRFFDSRCESAASLYAYCRR